MSKRLGQRIHFLAVFPVVGCILGWLIGSVVFSDSLVPWHSLGAPTSPPISFVRRSSQIIVRSQDGLLYSFRLGGSGNWLPIDQTDVDDLPKDSYDKCPEVSPPRLEGVIAEAEACHPYGDIILTSRYAIDLDGTVWWWREHSGARKWEHAAYGALLFAALALLVLIVTLLCSLVDRLGPHSTTRRAKPSEPDHD